LAELALALDGVTRPDVRPLDPDPLLDLAGELDDFLEVALAAPEAELARPPDLPLEAGAFLAEDLAAGLAGVFLADPAPLAEAPPAAAFFVVDVSVSVPATLENCSLSEAKNPWVGAGVGSGAGTGRSPRLIP